MSELLIKRQAGALGAVITGVDLRGRVDDDVFAVLHQALLDHLVICIRGQAAMRPEDQVAFAARWGEIEPHPYVPPIEGHPEIMRVYDPNPITEMWHSDFTYATKPPAISLLLARIIPEYGGDTMFSNGYLVYERLSEGMRACLDGLAAYHRGTDLAAATAGLRPEDIEHVHPVVRTHPETGRRAVFVNGDYVKHFDGWTVEESTPLLEYLYARFAAPELTYRHRWEVGDLLLWDNRCSQHRVVGDTGGADRELHRVTISGDAVR